MSFEEENNIVYIDGKRAYIVDLSKREYSFECTEPIYFKYQDFEVFESSWKQLILKILIYLDEKSPKSQDELLSLKNDWGKQAVFSNTKLKNYVSFKDIYINLNHTALHAVRTIQLILNFYNVDISYCKLLIHRQPYSESENVRKYYINLFKNAFISYLKKYKYNENSINIILKTIDVANKYLPKVSKGYDNVYLFDDILYFQNYASKYLDFMSQNPYRTDKNEAISKKCISLYLKFLKTFLGSQNEVI